MFFETTTSRLFFATALVLVGFFGRMIPHAWNITPIVAIGLVAGVYLGASYAWSVPITAMVLSDFFIGFYSIEIMGVVYFSFALVGLLGLLIRKLNNTWSRSVVSLCASTIFFLITNWAVWQFSPMYQKTLNGLMTSYAMGLPFLKNAIVGDLLYTLGLFALVEVVLVVITAYGSSNTQLIGKQTVQ